MTERSAADSVDWSLAEARAVDQVCLRFEACWRAADGWRPRLEDPPDGSGEAGPELWMVGGEAGDRGAPRGVR
jgi:hypothetical protein